MWKTKYKLQRSVQHSRYLVQSARAVPGNLLRCFVRREEMPKRGFGCARYCMYLDGEGPGHSPRKFLLAAMQTHRWVKNLEKAG